jgi:transposase
VQRLTTVFNKLLDLQGAWVKGVTFEKGSVVVTVAARARLHRCPAPACGFGARGGYDRHVRTWRHLALGKWPLLIRATVMRVNCPKHGILHEAVPWAEPNSQFTRDFEEFVAWLAREMTITALTRLVKIAWVTVSNIVERVVGRKLDDKRLNGLFAVGIDEVSYRKGHKYLTVIADHAGAGPVWLSEGRSRKSVGAFFDALGPERSAKLEAVTLDMCEPFIQEVRARAPNAEIAFDPFHVVKLATESVQEVRRAEARETKGTPHAAALKGSRWALLKSPENLGEDERLKLAEVARLNSRVYRAYLLKEELRALYRCGPRAAERHLTAWVSWATRSRLQPFVKLARTIQRHREGILAAIRLGLSNGRLEGLNNKIGVIKHRAYGFHSAAALIAMIYLCAGNLGIKLPI